jgi:hypothetical protein
LKYCALAPLINRTLLQARKWRIDNPQAHFMAGMK